MKKLLFLGDSITDSHRLWLPDDPDGLGDGFVKMISDSLQNQNETLQIINRGHDGLTLPHLIRNLERDCFCLKPDVITVLIGINDVGVSMQTGVSLEAQQFEQQFFHLTEMLCKHTDADLLFMAPFIFPHPREYMNWIPETLVAETVIQKAAARYQTPFCPLHDSLNKMAGEYGYDTLTIDGIHPTRFGAECIRDKWLSLYRGSFSDGLSSHF